MLINGFITLCKRKCRKKKYTDLFDVVICKANSITSKLKIILKVKWICVLCTTNAVFYVHWSWPIKNPSFSLTVLLENFKSLTV